MNPQAGKGRVRLSGLLRRWRGRWEVQRGAGAGFLVTELTRKDGHCTLAKSEMGAFSLPVLFLEMIISAVFTNF